MPEKLALDKPFRQGRTIDLDEGMPGTRAARMDGVGGKLFARAALAEQQDRGAGRGHLCKLRQDGPQPRRAPHEHFRAGPFPQDVQQAPVFLQHPVALLPVLHGLGNQRSQHAQKAHVLFERFGSREQPVGGQRADDPAFHLDGHADEGNGLFAAAASGPVQEQRLHEHVGDDQRLAAFDDLAGDALAELVAALALRLRRHAVGGFNGDLAVRLVEKRDHAAHHAGMFGHDLKHGFEIVGQVGSAVQNLQDLEQQTEFLDLITDLHEPTP